MGLLRATYFQILLALFLGVLSPSYAQNESSEKIELLDAKDLDILVEDQTPFEAPTGNGRAGESAKSDGAPESSIKEDTDELESLKGDLSDIYIDDGGDASKSDFKDALDTSKGKGKTSPTVKVKKGVKNLHPTVKDNLGSSEGSGGGAGGGKNIGIFDVGSEESKLIEISRFVEGKIPENEWNELTEVGHIGTYVVQKGDYLWKIAEKLFGSGFYYAKIWSLNPYIKNPHEIEPGMTLSFTSGSSEAPPEIQLGEFGAGDKLADSKTGSEIIDFNFFGDDTEPPWLREKKNLISQGVFVQYASENTYSDLVKISRQSLNKEYEKYEPPLSDIEVKVNSTKDQYDTSGFDKNSKVIFKVKEGFSLHTFVSSNVIQDLGEVDSSSANRESLHTFDNIYVKFNTLVHVAPGDRFSIYAAQGKVKHKLSDREGYKYTIVGQIELNKKVNHLWEAKIIEANGILRRKDRVTVYTPRINRIIKTFNSRNIEAIIVAGHETMGSNFSSGDVVYLDRGRADGVEVGNVFETYSFTDPTTKERITPDPTFKTGEVTVITLTDNFATGLITYSRQEISQGVICITKSAESASKGKGFGSAKQLKDIQGLESKALEELDVEVNLDDINDDLLKKAEKIQLNDDELEELEKLEREKSIMKDHERDLYELERLESEIESAESQLNAAKADEDKYLEKENLNKLEKGLKDKDPNAYGSLNDLEHEVGKKYMDEDLNSKENPYGLTEYDIEEIDELLNVDIK